jgi:hypothetical protein
MKALLAKGLIGKELRPRAPMFFDRQYGWIELHPVASSRSRPELRLNA